MTDARSFLRDTLRQVIAGGDVTNDELASAVPDPAALRGAELKAYYGLSYWADDDDIRVKDPAYGPSRRAQLVDLLAKLEASDEPAPTNVWTRLFGRKPAKLPARQEDEAMSAVRTIRAFLNDTGGDWDWDDFTSCAFRDPQVDSIRQRAAGVSLPIGAREEQELLALAKEAENLAAGKRD